jgi:cilia- and flagella-associated protein 298
LNANDSALWWAGKELVKGKLLKDYIGKNEKTKIICKMTKVGAGMPAREAAIDEETYKKMISFYHKK